MQTFELWLPILVSTVVVFFASFIAWVVSPLHKQEIKKLDDEDEFLAMLKSANVPAGTYMFPLCTGGKEMKDPEFVKKLKENPSGILNVWHHRRSMPMCMLGSSIIYFIVGVFVAYLAHFAFQGGEPFMDVFRFASAAAIAAYVFGSIPGSIWFGVPVRSMVTCAIDGIVFGLLTGLVFAWMWPGAPVGV